MVDSWRCVLYWKLDHWCGINLTFCREFLTAAPLVSPLPQPLAPLSEASTPAATTQSSLSAFQSSISFYQTARKLRLNHLAAVIHPPITNPSPAPAPAPTAAATTGTPSPAPTSSSNAVLHLYYIDRTGVWVCRPSSGKPSTLPPFPPPFLFAFSYLCFFCCCLQWRFIVCSLSVRRTAQMSMRSLYTPLHLTSCSLALCRCLLRPLPPPPPALRRPLLLLPLLPLPLPLPLPQPQPQRVSW